jgi:uncharacterized protein
VARKWSNAEKSVFLRVEKKNEMKWYENGQLKSKCFWMDGKKEGEEMQWHKNGQLWSKYFWKDGEKEDEEIQWYENGQLALKRFWKDGKLVKNVSE